MLVFVKVEKESVGLGGVSVVLIACLSGCVFLSGCVIPVLRCVAMYSGSIGSFLGAVFLLLSGKDELVVLC